MEVGDKASACTFCASLGTSSVKYTIMTMTICSFMYLSTLFNSRGRIYVIENSETDYRFEKSLFRAQLFKASLA